MSLQQHSNGKWYGSALVLLTRIVDGETEQLVGSRPPFGGIHVEEFDGKRFVEEWDEFWTARGFEIVEPSILAEARRKSREKS